MSIRATVSSLTSEVNIMNNTIQTIFNNPERKVAERDRIEVLSIVEGQLVKVIIYSDEYFTQMEIYDELVKVAEFLAYQYVEPGIETDLGPWQNSNWDVVRSHPGDNETDNTIAALIAYAPQLADITNPVIR